MVGVVAESRIPKRNVERLQPGSTSAASHRRLPSVLDARPDKRSLETLAIEMRQAAGTGEGANIKKALDSVGSKRGKKLRNFARGMPNGVKSRHEDLRCVSAESREEACNRSILLGGHRPQV